MFGLSKTYANTFKPHLNGYAVQTWRGLKYVSTAQHEELVASFSNTIRFDFGRFWKSTLLLVSMIIILVFIQTIFSLPKVLKDASIYFAIIPIVIIQFKPFWNHYSLERKTYSTSETLSQNRNWFGRIGQQWSSFSWKRIWISLLIFSSFTYLLAPAAITQQASWVAVALMILSAGGLINFIMAAVWKITHNR